MKTYYVNYELQEDFSLVFEKRFKARDFDDADYIARQLIPTEDGDYYYSVHDISHYYTWQKDNVIKTKEGYLTQCTGYRKAFTKKELFDYFVLNYAPQF
jgi:hypothetical protein